MPLNASIVSEAEWQLFPRNKLRSTVFNIVFAVATAITGLVCYALTPFKASKLIKSIFTLYGRVVIFAFRKIMKVTITYEGRENLPPVGSVIFAPKHQSYADSYSLWLQGLNARFVLGKFTADRPIMRDLVPHLDMLTADENGGVKAFRHFKRQVDALGQGEKRIVIYPEGEISQVGFAGKYHAGIYYLYKKFNCPVVPIATTMGICWPMNEYLKSSGDVRVKYLPIISPGLSKSEFMKRLETDIESATTAMLDAALSVPMARRDPRGP